MGHFGQRYAALFAAARLLPGLPLVIAVQHHLVGLHAPLSSDPESSFRAGGVIDRAGTTSAERFLYEAPHAMHRASAARLGVAAVVSTSTFIEHRSAAMPSPYPVSTTDVAPVRSPSAP